MIALTVVNKTNDPIAVTGAESRSAGVWASLALSSPEGQGFPIVVEPQAPSVLTFSRAALVDASFFHLVHSKGQAAHPDLLATARTLAINESRHLRAQMGSDVAVELAAARSSRPDAAARAEAVLIRKAREGTHRANGPSRFVGYIGSSLLLGGCQACTYAPDLAITLLAAGAALLLLSFSLADSGSIREARLGFAQLVSDAVRHGGPVPPYSLYLRSMSVDALLAVENPERIPGTPSAPIDPHSFDVEDLLADAAASDFPLLALGALSGRRREWAEFTGSGVIGSDGKWQDHVKQLLHHAKRVFVVPGLTPSIVWETSYVRSTAPVLRKTIWVMPPRQADRFLVSEADVGAYWRSVTRRFSADGATLPAFQSRGMVFRLGDDGTVTWSRPFSPRRQAVTRAFLAGFVPFMFLQRDPVRFLRRQLADAPLEEDSRLTEPLHAEPRL